MAPTRRRTLAAVAGLASLGTVAGCSGDTGDGQGTDAGADGPTAEASFFVFGDVAEAVAGDAATANLLVPIGQHGHGWEPGPRVREVIQDADLFVHGMGGFQPWVDDILTDLEADDVEVATVDVSAELDLLPAGDEHEADEHEDHEGDDHEEGHEDAEDHDGESHDGHDHGGQDPHFWMDPLRLQEAVDAVRSGLDEVDPDNADTYADNAEAYVEELEAIHERIESTVAAAETDTLLVAGHDSMSYLADRYGVHVEALTNVSPDDRPTTRDIDRAQEIIVEHDLEYICADPLESQEAAQQLVEETDAREVLPLTAMPGLTEDWEDDDWGYVEVMENVNLPTLEGALDA